jgi:RNA polymerase sigma-70 factor (ECF subfamily)
VHDERLLLQRLRAGDEDAFMSLVARHDASLRRVAGTFVHSQAVADDVVQETWLAVLVGLRAFEGRSSLRTWMFQILVNRARSRAVREARDVPFSSLALQDEPAVDPAAFATDGHWASSPARLDLEPETQLLRAELRERLLAIVDALPAAQRAVITLRDIAGCSAEETCELLELSEGNQRVLLHRARTRTRSELAPIVEAGA